MNTTKEQSIELQSRVIDQVEALKSLCFYNGIDLHLAHEILEHGQSLALLAHELQEANVKVLDSSFLFSAGRYKLPTANYSLVIKG